MSYLVTLKLTFFANSRSLAKQKGWCLPDLISFEDSISRPTLEVKEMTAYWMVSFFPLKIWLCIRLSGST
jgi:hypothetical protein